MSVISIYEDAEYFSVTDDGEKVDRAEIIDVVESVNVALKLKIFVVSPARRVETDEGFANLSDILVNEDEYRLTQKQIDDGYKLIEEMFDEKRWDLDPVEIIVDDEEDQEEDEPDDDFYDE